ncbi:AbrB/MazE/SpoVT family DNA-binding domain-containing protein [Candidatus Woesearchaeota archaeon]|nr:AbrB/MazE/SpoVT family DNA-binding domain-containing protein [Candidatus Woesearchaeota archaeon]
MFDIGLTKMSAKGQIVIPQDMRKDFRVGDKLLVIKNGDQLILKKASQFSKRLENDLEFARRTEDAYRRYEKGEFTEMSHEEFMKEIRKW